MSTETKIGENSLEGVASRPSSSWEVVRDETTEREPLRLRLRRRGGRRYQQRRQTRRFLDHLLNFARQSGSFMLSPAEVSYVMRTNISSILHNDISGEHLDLSAADHAPRRTSAAWPADELLLFSTIEDFRDLIAGYTVTEQLALRTRRRLLQNRRAAHDSRVRRQNQQLPTSSPLPQHPPQPQQLQHQQPTLTNQPLDYSMPTHPIIIKPEDRNEDVMVNLFNTYFPSP